MRLLGGLMLRVSIALPLAVAMLAGFVAWLLADALQVGPKRTGIT